MNWTTTADEKIRACFAEGLNDLRIAARIGNGCTRGAVSKRRLALGLRHAPGCRTNAPAPPSDPIASGPSIDAMFRAAERPSKACSVYRRQPPPTLMSRGESMT